MVESIDEVVEQIKEEQDVSLLKKSYEMRAKEIREGVLTNEIPKTEEVEAFRRLQERWGCGTFGVIAKLL
jgi:hypothetical protein